MVEKISLAFSKKIGLGPLSIGLFKLKVLDGPKIILIFIILH
jgi:hypothetical protein